MRTQIPDELACLSRGTLSTIYFALRRAVAHTMEEAKSSPNERAALAMEASDAKLLLDRVEIELDARNADMARARDSAASSSPRPSRKR